MMIRTFLLASPLWEQIGTGRYSLALGCFTLAGLCVLISGGIHLFLESRRRLGAAISAVGLALALVQFAIAWQVRGVDFQPAVDAMGKVGPPSWVEALLVPFLPVIFNAGLLLAHRRAGKPRA
jgi:hypothetical protein